MFDKLIKELKNLERTELSIPLEADADGYSDKECPNEECLFEFKIHSEDWRNLVRDEEVFCPSCRHTARSKSWFTTEQVERAKEQAVAHLKSRVNQAMRDDARDWNSRQRRGSFLKITLDVKGGGPAHVIVPIAAAEPMRLRTQCESCGCRYSFIGAAFFCPACGANSASHTFDQTLAAIRIGAQSGPALRQALSRDDAEVLLRALLEKGFQDAVMCFQRLNEQLRDLVPDAPQARRNLFQNLEEGSRYWAPLIGKDFDALLGTGQMTRLRRYFQQRHLLSHSQGVVDADYITRSRDTRYEVGQRLVLKQADALDFVDLVKQLGDALISSVQGLALPGRTEGLRP